ncbi:ABC transporter permease [Pseudonocardia sp. GCM10023141]|uniref:ABC transporter permease n=1 Tax=Pseudonocardia sp. GCM10023141 TaxID=3252653 RepID=UPI0036102414
MTLLDPVKVAPAPLAEPPSVTARMRTAWRRWRTSPRPHVIVARRLVDGALIVLAVLTIVFFLTNAIGDPATLMLAPEAPAAQVAALRQQLGLDAPLLVRYLDAMGSWLTGNFGNSLWQNVPALPLALSGMVKTAYLALATLVIAVPIALVLGLWAGMRPRSVAARLVRALAAVSVSTPTFWVGLVLILVFAVNLRVLPTSGYGGLRYAVLPAIALALGPLGRLAQLTSAAVASESGRLYVTAARARGVGDRRIARTHVLPNAAIPVLTLLGDEVATLLNGAVVVEVIFGWPGIGNTMIQAIGRRDLPLILACVAVVAVVVVVVNLVVDLLYVAVDPRVRR